MTLNGSLTDFGSLGTNPNSGDTINTASRIRSACTDLNQKFLISVDMKNLLDLEEWQTESMGIVDLKGKNNDLELFALKI